MERLSQKFDENVLDATKKFEKLITDKKEIEGLPATALGMAAQAAVSKVFLVEILFLLAIQSLFPSSNLLQLVLSYLMHL